jgi:uncharacterized protein (DUF3084 family)
MNKNGIKNLALILLIGLTIFSMVRYISELKEKIRLQDDLTQAQGQVTALTEEKQNLLQELGKEQELNGQLTAKNVNLKAYLKASKERISRLFRDNYKTQNELEDMSTKFAVLKAENRALIDIHKRMYLENEEFKFKLGSVVELKKAIKELKAKKRKALGLEIPGNFGFLTKDGHLTSEKVRIEVIPARTKE